MGFARSYPAVAGSLAAMRSDLTGFAQAAGAGAGVAGIVLAASEAATNAVVHGYGGGDAAQEFHVEVASDDAELTVSVADDGRGFRPRRHSPGLGVGLAVIAQVADALQLSDRAGGGVLLEMRFAIGKV